MISGQSLPALTNMCCYFTVQSEMFLIMLTDNQSFYCIQLCYVAYFWKTYLNVGDCSRAFSEYGCVAVDDLLQLRKFCCLGSHVCSNVLYSIAIIEFLCLCVVFKNFT